MGMDNSYPKSELAKRVYRLHLRVVRRLNDTHIFVQAAQPSISARQKELAASTHKKDRRYYTPKVGRKETFSRRKDHEVADILNRFMDRELYENLIVTAVSQYEAFLFDVLYEVLKEYPKKLVVRVDGTSKDRDVSLEAILDASSYREVIDNIIEERCQSFLYASPKQYMAYLAKVVHLNTDHTTYREFMEIKAARDIIVHNNGVINDTYIAKAGQCARGKLGRVLKIDEHYFDEVIAILKKLSGSASRDVAKAFPGKSKEEAEEEN